MRLPVVTKETGLAVLRELEHEEDNDFVVHLLGRLEDCDVTIDNLGVSRYHSEILQKDGFYVLRDLKSNNGTFVNGKRVDNYNLNDGDEISIGKFTISFAGKANVVLPEPTATGEG